MKHTVILLFILSLFGCSGNNGTDIIASGVIEGTDINVGAEASGRVKEVRVEEGSRVLKGDILVIVDDTEYKIQLRQAIANMESFESTYRLTVKGSRKEDVMQAEAAYTAAESDYKRMKDLLSSQVITQKQYDDAYAKFIATQQTFEKLQKGSRPEEIDVARQKRDLAVAQADLLKKKLRDCSIVAPSDGIVTLKAIEPGELVAVGMNVIRLTNLDKVKLTIYVNEQELPRVRLGDKATISIDGEKNKTFDGTVIYISPTAEFTPKNVQTKEERTKLVFGVKIEINNPDGALKPGLPADATITVSAASGS